MLSVLLVQMNFQKKKKRFPVYHMSSVHEAAGKTRGKAFQKQSQDDWERGL